MTSLTKGIASGIALGVFAFFWLSIMISAWNAGECRSSDHPPEDKLRFCDRSLKYSGWMDFMPQERAEGSIIHLEKGIALAALGRENDAIKSFQKAFDDAGATSGPRRKNLMDRIEKEADAELTRVWEKAMTQR